MLEVETARSRTPVGTHGPKKILKIPSILSKKTNIK